MMTKAFKPYYFYSILAIGIILLISNTHALYGQISPGDLVDYHADLEGMFKCTECHKIGDKIDEEKCLACHKPLQKRIQLGKGYHYSNEVRNKSCISCHSDHHGRNFDIIRFDENEFDHSLTDYVLEGAHKKQDCKACHKDENIKDPLILDKKYTYLGLKTDCLLCHEDIHQNTLSKDCKSCHIFDTFKDAGRFKHADTKFPLLGKHKQVDCIECHQVSKRNGRDFQEFANVEFSSCTSCHEDVHHGRLGNRCTDCHNENSFQTILSNGNFNHNKTEFPLRGKHKKINCKSCHTDSNNSNTAFQEFTQEKTFECILCHTDIHENKFGTDCASCHNENNFQISDSKIDIDHSLTDFPLEGAHEIVDCNQCHVADLTDPIEFNQCLDCHSDYHKGQFLVDEMVQDCKQCHSTKSFQGSNFTFDQHKETAFPLDGAHLATPCFSCHYKSNQWEFRNIGEQCADCHEDIHQASLDESYYPNQKCTNCHSTNSWKRIVFDHSLTSFELEGQHKKTNCIACHIDESNKQSQVFQTSLTNSTCKTCHNDVHYDQFALNGITNCDRCHGFGNWEAIYFVHDSTNFILEGAHLNIACASCHKPILENNNRFVNYKIEKFECIDCHQ